jgi:hypothetical protein
MAEAPEEHVSRLLRTIHTKSGVSWWGRRSVWTRHITYWCIALGLISLTAFDNTREIPHDTDDIGVFAWFVAVVLVVGVMGLVFMIREWEKAGVARTLSRSLVLFLCMLGLAAMALFFARRWGVEIQECTTSAGEEVCDGPASPQQVLAMLAWQAANAVPALDLTDAFEWPRPARSDAVVVGATIVVLRLWVLIGVLGVIKRIWDRWGPIGSAHAPGPDEATVDPGARMESDPTFIARAITEGPLDDVSSHVAWGDDATDPEQSLILMRNDDPSPGEAPYRVVWGAASFYGGVTDIQVGSDRTTVQLTEHCATTLGAPQTICIEHDVEAVAVDALRSAVRRVMTGS